MNPSPLFVIVNQLREDLTMPSSNEVYAKVTKVLVYALGVEEADIKPSATLQGDLGAESIDFLDIIFRLEVEFRIKINQDELFPQSFLLDDSAFINDRQLTDEGLAALMRICPTPTGLDWSVIGGSSGSTTCSPSTW